MPLWLSVTLLGETCVRLYLRVHYRGVRGRQTREKISVNRSPTGMYYKRGYVIIIIIIITVEKIKTYPIAVHVITTKLLGPL
jgi:ABC-type xylose transport system permease subunit